MKNEFTSNIFENQKRAYTFLKEYKFEKNKFIFETMFGKFIKDVKSAYTNNIFKNQKHAFVVFSKLHPVF